MKKTVLIYLSGVTPSELREREFHKNIKQGGGIMISFFIFKGIRWKKNDTCLL